MKSLLKYILVAVLACLLTCSIYNIAFNYFNCGLLKDFYVGISIYEDFNKYFDLAVFFIYILTFFAIYFLLPNFDFKPKFGQFKFPKFHINKVFEKFLLCITSFGYICLHPMNGILYPKLIILILALVGLSLFNIFKDNKYKYFSLGSLILIFFGLNYNIGSIVLDMHHHGEMFTPFYLNIFQHFEYYKDTMLVHGFCDIVPSLFSLFFFKTNSVNGFFMGRILYINTLLLITYYLSLFVFNRRKYCILPIFIFPISFIQPLFLSFLAILKFIDKPAVALFLQIVFGFFFMLFSTTCGTFYVFASLPFGIYLAVKLFKDKKYSKLLINIMVICILSFLLKDFMANYLEKAQFYVQGNLFAFGNGFPLIRIKELWSSSIKLFMYIAWCPFVICFVKELKKGISDTRLFAYLFLILFPLLCLNYSFGRIDYIAFGRIRNFSFAYLTIFLPFLFSQVEWFKKLWRILAIVVILFAFQNFSNPFNYSKFVFEEKQIQNIQVLQEFFKNKNENVLDLTDNGILYYFIKQKSAIPYSSFYNCITTLQAKSAMKDLPDFVIIKMVSFSIFDNIYPSLRVYPIYREILLSGKYQMKEIGNIILLEKTKGNIKFTEKEKLLLDKNLATNYLQKLPSVWGRSVKTLPLKEVQIKFKRTNFENKTIITFEKPVNGKDIGFISFVPRQEKYSYIQANSKFTKLFFDAQKDIRQLVPVDSLPSFMLSDISKIIIDVNVDDIKFYSRNN